MLLGAFIHVNILELQTRYSTILTRNILIVVEMFNFNQFVVQPILVHTANLLNINMLAHRYKHPRAVRCTPFIPSNYMDAS